jgi:hypothetical protein
MDVCASLETYVRGSYRESLPDRWRDDPVLGSFGSLIEIAGAIRRLGAQSDLVVRALLNQPPTDDWVVPVILVGFVPVVLARCRNRDVVDEFVGELSMEIAFMHRNGVPAVNGLLASRLLDRAWDRVRAPRRRRDPSVPFDPADLTGQQFDRDPGPEQVALDRLVLAEVRSFVDGCRVNREPLVRVWNSAVELADLETRTPGERDRWKYVRAQLRRRCHRWLAA